MKWNVLLSPNDFSAYQFTSVDGKEFICKFNKSQGSFRMKYNDLYGVVLADTHQLFHRKFVLTNVYGSEIGLVTKNLWHENTGTVVFNHTGKKINYKIDSYSSFIEITIDNTIHFCEIKNLPHPGRELHYMPVLIALAWMHSVPAAHKMESAA